MSIDKKYRALLLDISHEITPRELKEMEFLCVEMIPESRLEDADILHFFRELEKQDKLRYDNLQWLVYLLEKVKRQDLVFRLQSFQFFQRTYFGELGGRSVASTAYHREPAQQKNIINNIGKFVDFNSWYAYFFLSCKSLVSVINDELIEYWS